MIELIKKSEQFNDIIFDGKFFANKPVYNGKSTVKPYSNIFYWSNAYVKDDCEFGLHPHEGFEIMSFILEGANEHFDTATKVWTPLKAGDFQVIQSNSGIKHQERITKNSRAFQIWFDPNFYAAIEKPPTYADYYAKDFKSEIENGINTITYVGKGSLAKVMTPGLTIKKLNFEQQTETSLSLNEEMSYTFYVLNGQGIINHQNVGVDDAIRASKINSLEIDFQGELFYIETPTNLNYSPIWE